MVAVGSAKDGDVYIFYTPDPDVRAGGEPLPVSQRALATGNSEERCG